MKAGSSRTGASMFRAVRKNFFSFGQAGGVSSSASMLVVTHMRHAWWHASRSSLSITDMCQAPLAIELE